MFYCWCSEESSSNWTWLRNWTACQGNQDISWMCYNSKSGLWGIDSTGIWRYTWTSSSFRPTCVSSGKQTNPWNFGRHLTLLHCMCVGMLEELVEDISLFFFFLRKMLHLFLSFWMNMKAKVPLFSSSSHMKVIINSSWNSQNGHCCNWLPRTWRQRPTNHHFPQLQMNEKKKKKNAQEWVPSFHLSYKNKLKQNWIDFSPLLGEFEEAGVFLHTPWYTPKSVG